MCRLAAVKPAAARGDLAQSSIGGGTDAIVNHTVTTDCACSGFGTRNNTQVTDSIGPLENLSDSGFAVYNQNVTVSSLGLDLLDTVNNPFAALSIIDAALDTIGTKAATLASSLNRIHGVERLAGHMSDILSEGIGLLVDADLKSESAVLRANQAKMSLATTAMRSALASARIVDDLFHRQSEPEHGNDQS